MRRRIVLDTDMGSDVDDALCLALALASPEIELVAVTHVARDTQLRARISRHLLDLAGRSDVPVFAGCSDPISAGTSRFVWFGHEGKGILDDATQPSVSPEHAVDALLRLFRTHDDLELVAVGPMTNVAAALRRDPSFAGRVRQLTLMGGHLRRFEHSGRVFDFGVDYNLCSDPDASIELLRAGIKTRLVTADVTFRTWLSEDDVRQIQTRRTPFHRALCAAIRIWMNPGNVTFLHDPLALACTFDESFCTFEDLSIEASIEAGLFRTRESRPGASAFPMRCATAVDAERFRNFFRSRIVDYL
jgi:purine nucleosidase